MFYYTFVVLVIAIIMVLWIRNEVSKSVESCEERDPEYRDLTEEEIEYIAWEKFIQKEKSFWS